MAAAESAAPIATSSSKLAVDDLSVSDGRLDGDVRDKGALAVRVAAEHDEVRQLTLLDAVSELVLMVSSSRSAPARADVGLASIFSATSSCIPGITWLYVSKVTPKEA